MKTKSNMNFTLSQPLTWIATGILTSGISISLLPQPSFAQLEVGAPSSGDLLPPRNNRPTRNNQPNAEELGDFEVKGNELIRCVTEEGKDKKKCNPVMSGYEQIVNFANQIYNQGNVAIAESVFRQLTTSHPKEATPYYKLGIILDRQGKVNEAIQQYRRAIEINSRHALARNSLGVALAKQGQLQEAITEWQQALEINAGYADALTNMGLALFQQGKQSEAVDALKKAKELYLKQNEFQKAKRIDDILLEINSQST